MDYICELKPTKEIFYINETMNMSDSKCCQKIIEQTEQLRIIY